MKRLFAGALLLLAGCGDEAVPAPAPAPGPVSYRGTLSAELRGTADVSLIAGEGQALDVAITLHDVDTRGLFDATVPLRAPGRREPFPEAESELSTAVFSLAPSADPSGRCGGEPVTVALSLHRRAPTTRFGGSLAAYCGPRAQGVPAWIFRLSGTLQTD